MRERVGARVPITPSSKTQPIFSPVKKLPVRRQALSSPAKARGELEQCRRLCRSISLAAPDVRITLRAFMHYRDDARVLLEIAKVRRLDEKWSDCY